MQNFRTYCFYAQTRSGQFKITYIQPRVRLLEIKTFSKIKQRCNVLEERKEEIEKERILSIPRTQSVIRTFELENKDKKKTIERQSSRFATT